MAITLTPEAVGVVRRSLELAKLDPSKAGVRLRLVGDDVMPRFAEQPESSDEVVECEDVRVFVDARILSIAADIEIGVSEEHERLVVRPLG